MSVTGRFKRPGSNPVLRAVPTVAGRFCRWLADGTAYTGYLLQLIPMMGFGKALIK